MKDVTAAFQEYLQTTTLDLGGFPIALNDVYPPEYKQKLFTIFKEGFERSNQQYQDLIQTLEEAKTFLLKDQPLHAEFILEELKNILQQSNS